MMHVTTVSATPGGGLAPIGDRNVTTPVGTPPLRIFRSTAYLDFDTGGTAERLLVDPEASRLAGSFEPLDYDARTIDGATVTQFDSKGVLIDLTVPRRLLRIELPTLKVTGPGYRMQLFRMEAGAPAAEPFLERVNGLHFGREYDGGVGIVNVDLQGHTILGEVGIVAEHGYVTVVTSPVFEIGSTERQFLVRIVAPGGTTIAFGPGDIVELRVRSYPTNPRIGVAFPNAGEAGADPMAEDAVFFWRGRGEVGASTPAAEGLFGEGGRFGPELLRLANRYAELLADNVPGGSPPTLPSPSRVALVFESDSPCHLDWDQLDVAYRLGRRSSPTGEEKQVVRFAPGRREAHAIGVSVPADSSIVEATLRLDVSLSSDRTLGEEDGAGAPLPRTGAHVREGVAAAQPFTPSEALLASGVAVALLPTTARSELTIEIREDHGGVPGRVLGTSPLAAGEPGHARWSVVRFGEPLLLATRMHWLVVRASAGSAVWLAEAAAGPTTGAAAVGVHILRPAGAPGLWQDAGRLDGQRALYGLRTRGGTASESPLLAVRVGGIDVDIQPDGEGGGLLAELAPSLAAQLEADPGSGLMEVPVTLEATGPGRVTVYPIDLVYEYGP